MDESRKATGIIGEPHSTQSPVDQLLGVEPFRRQPVGGWGVFTHVERFHANFLARHNHRDWWQIFTAYQSADYEATWWEPSGKKITCRLLGGTVWCLPPSWPHEVRWRETADAIVSYAHTGWVRRFFSQLPIDASTESLSRYVLAVPSITDIGADLRQYAVIPNGLTDWRVAAAGAHFGTLLLEARRILSGTGLTPSSERAHKILALLDEYMVKTASGRVTVPQLARNLSMSPRHLRRIFRQATGISPQEWIVKNKAARAKGYLQQGFTCGETVEKVGLADESHLQRIIREFYGVSPGTLRLRAQDRPNHP